MKTVILLLYFFRVCLIFGLADTEITPVQESGIDEDFVYKNNAIHSRLYRTAKRYFCSVRNSNESELLVYGTREWWFPAQDVTLNLDYPGKNSEYYNTSRIFNVFKIYADFQFLGCIEPGLRAPGLERQSHSIRYRLTEVVVIVQYEGSSSSGFITSGGMMRDHISMKFLFNNITRLSYQFYLYGVPIHFLDNTENYTAVYNIC